MLERCADDPDVHAVLLEETDRFARNAQDHLAVKSFLKKHNVVLIATQQPQFISMSDFKKAEEIMKKHNKGANRSRKHNWFLAGLVYCEHCGSLMSGEKHEKSTGKIYKYYRCMGPKNHGHTCNEPYANIEKIHDQLYNWITGLEFTDTFFDGLRQELMSLMENQGDTVKDRLGTLQNRKEVIEKKMDKLEDQMLSEVIPQDRIEKKYKPLRDELTAVEAKIEKLNQPSSNMDEEKIETIIKFIKRLPELYDAFNKKERKQFLKWFTTKIMIKDKKIVDIAYTPGFQAMVDRDIVRISETWLPLVDSFLNHEFESNKFELFVNNNENLSLLGY